VEADEEPYTRLNSGYAEGLESFQVLDSRALPANVKFGSMYETWCLNAPLYLQFLERRLTMYNGVEFVTATLISFQQVSLNFPGATIINCLGMGLQYKGGYDKTCFHVRGQTLLVRAPKDCIYKNMTVTHGLSNAAFSFVIPRPCDGGVIVGGTRQPGNMASTPSLDDTEKLVKHAVERFLELLVYKEGIPTLDVVKVNVGFRPMRKGGALGERDSWQNHHNSLLWFW
jgi:D-amino-acid oxidase